MVNMKKNLPASGTVHTWRNEYTYPRDEVMPLQTAMQAVRSISAILAVIVLSAAMFSSVRSRREEWQTLFLLGARCHDLRLLLLREGLCFGVTGILAGLSGALIFFVLLLPLLSQFVHFSLQYSFSILHLGISAGLCGGAVAIAYGLAGLYLKRLVLLEPPKKKKMRHLRKGRKSGCLTYRTIWLRQWTAHPLQCFLKFCVIAGIFFLPCFGIRNVNEQKKEVDRLEQEYGESYILDSIEPSFFLPDEKRGISKDKRAVWEGIYGLERLEAYQLVMPQNGIWADFSRWKDSEYYAALCAGVRQLFQYEFDYYELSMDIAESTSEKEFYEKKRQSLNEILENYEKNMSQGLLPCYICAVDSEITLERYLGSLDQGTVDLEAFFRGEEGILTLPSIEISGNGLITPLWKEKPDQRENSETALAKLSDITPGTELSFSSTRATQTIRINGIINSFKEETMVRFPYTNYAGMLICSENFLEKLSWRGDSYYQYVRAESALDAGSGTDSAMIRGLSGGSDASVTNYREKISGLRQELYIITGIYGAICGAGVCLLFLILYAITQLEDRYRSEQTYLFEALGMPSGWIVFFSFTQNLLMATVSIVGTILALSLYDFQERRQAFAGAILPEEITVRFRWTLGMNTAQFVGICVLCFLFCFYINKGKSKTERF